MDSDPETPRHLKTFRSSSIEVGRSVVPRAYQDSSLSSQMFGVKTQRDNDPLIPEPVSIVQELHHQWEERHYKDVKNKPLGHSRVVIDEPPEFTKSPDFAFGVSNVIHASASEAKTILNFEDDSDNEDVKNMYKKTHNHYEPGEQKKRDYKYNVDANSFKFGAPSAKGIDSKSGRQVKEVLEPLKEASCTITKKLKSHVSLGESKFRNSAPPQVLENEQPFGITNTITESAKDCFIVNEDPNDPSLGRSIPRICKGNESFVYGVIQSDGVESAYHSIQDEAVASLGLTEADFCKVLPIRVLSRIVLQSKVVTQEEFDEIVGNDTELSIKEFKLRLANHVNNKIVY
ncbi:hypothetical protein P9112_009817 [Eukaryota sp. TZLM1-RC]